MSLSGLWCRQEILQNVRQMLSLSLGAGSRRQGHVIRGKRPGVARTLKQRLEGFSLISFVLSSLRVLLFLWPIYNALFLVEENVQDPVLSARVNIGFPRLRPSRSAQLRERLDHLKAQHSSSALEKKARSQNRKTFWFDSCCFSSNLRFHFQLF